MKSIFRYIAAVVVVFAMTSCGKDFLDVNTNPNRSTEADPALLFTEAINQYSTNRTIDYGVAGSTWSQLWAGGGSRGVGVFTRPERYIISIFTNGNTWRAHYRNINKNLILAVEGAEAQSPPNNNAAAQAKIMMALTYWSSTMIWGDVPFSEANNPEFDSPNFDSQQDVLNGVIALLDEAIAQIDLNSGLKITGNDLIFSGDMEKWLRFANSLKFRILMIMVDADPSKADQIGAAISGGNMLASSADDAEFPYFDSPGNKNPIYQTLETFAGGANLFYFASKAMVDLMQESDDPRIPLYFDEGSGAATGEFIGVGPGEDATTSTSFIGAELVLPNSPDILFSYSEQLLLEAEAIIRGFAGGGELSSADDKYRAGIRANMEYYGVEETEIEAYLNALPSLTTLSAEDAREAIAKQQWVDLIQRPLEAWTQWRRAEVPALEVPKGAQTAGLIRRLQYPPDEVSANVNAPAQKELDEKMWFDK